jgi:hypothetical protein
MALTPMIVIGCGGSGGKVVVNLRQRLESLLRKAGWEEGIPDAWQLIYVDTPGAQESHIDFGLPMPAGDYISTSSQQNSYAVVDTSVSNFAAKGGHLDRLAGWRPAHDLNVPVALGAGQWRAVGRAVAFHGLTGLSSRIQQAMVSCISGQNQLQRLGERIGDPTTPGQMPFVVVVSSMAGGTGAGLVIDVCDVLRAVEPNVNDRIMALLFTAEVFQNLKTGAGLQPNTVGTMSEIMAGYFNRDTVLEPLYQGLVNVAPQGLTSSGPSYPFVLGMSTLAGAQLDNVADCYRAVTETLASAMIAPQVYKDLLEHQITNWSNNAIPNTTAWGFGNPPDSAGMPRPGGMVSSFGSSRLSVGSQLFEDYAVHRLTREVIEFLTEGYLDEGRQMLQDPNATQDEVLAYFRSTRGLEFVERCQLRELNDPEREHDQVLEVVMPQADLERRWREWLATLVNEAQTGDKLTKAQWLQTIGVLVPNRVARLVDSVASAVDSGIAELSQTLPDRLVAEMSRALSEFGVPVARELVDFACEHVASSVHQLRHEAEEEDFKALEWKEAAGQVLGKLSDKDKVLADHPVVGVEGAMRAASRLGYFRARAIVRRRVADFLERVNQQLLATMVSQLDQVREELGNPEMASAVSLYPGSTGVPSRFAPTPFDYCLIGVEQWPEIYRKLTRETAEREAEEFKGATATGTIRRMVGAGGFPVMRYGRPRPVARAIEVTEPWSMDRAFSLSTSLSVRALLERSREWIGRVDTPIGAFVSQDITTYLATTDKDGKPIVDHPKRKARFEDQLSAALASATPLIAMDPNVLARIHPDRDPKVKLTKITIQPIPVTGELRSSAERILSSYFTTDEIKHAFTDGSTATDSVLIVSQLSGAVHPAAVKSLTQPISNAWSTIKTSQLSIAGFWQYRRARVLPEFVPVAPIVLDRMIKGWFLGRALGAVPDPSERTGFLVAGSDGCPNPLPWPLLRCGQVGFDLAKPTHQREWLPAIMETLALAQLLVPTEPHILDGYQALHECGVRAPQIMEDWARTGSTRTSIAPAKVEHTGNAAAAIENLGEVFKRTRDHYQSEIDSTELRPDAGSFFRVDYGFSMFDRIVAAVNELLDQLPVLGQEEAPL